MQTPNVTITGLNTSNFSAVLGSASGIQVTQQLTGNAIQTIVANRLNSVNVSTTTTLNVTVNNLAQFSSAMAARNVLNQMSSVLSGLRR